MTSSNLPHHEDANLTGKRQKSEAIQQPSPALIEHAIVCTVTPRRNCGDCEQLRKDIYNHARECTTKACTIPFCVPLRRHGRDLELEAVQGMSDALVLSSSAQKDKHAATIETERKNVEDGGGRDSIAGEDARVQTSRLDVGKSTVQDNKDSDTITVVHLRGYFDGTRNFSGQWFEDGNPIARSSFLYTFHDGDVADPDGTMPCGICKKAGGLFTDFLACDLCDNVFHLSCVGLQNMPETAWFCSECERIKSAWIPEACKSSDRIFRLPPTRDWNGQFLVDEERVQETFRIKFSWRPQEMANDDGIIADVTGHGSNTFGAFDLNGTLRKYELLKKGYPLTLLKKYVSEAPA